VWLPSSARSLSSAVGGRYDALGEWEDAETFLSSAREQGVEEGAARAATSRLFPCTGAAVGHHSWPAPAATFAPPAGRPDVAEPEEREATEPGSSDSSDNDVACIDEAEGPVPVAGFAVSRAGTLHFVGAGRCARLPGQDYVLGGHFANTRPPPGEYTRACKDCWPQLRRETEAVSDSSSDA
jgi:hypothetical protein